MIFLDRSIPKGVADALKQVRDDVAWLEDKFPHDVKDAMWLPEAGKHGWLVISRDKRIRSRPGERRALMEGGVGCFILTQKQDLTRWGFLRLIVLALDDMERVYADKSKPFICAVGRTGTIKQIAL
jgi:PIN like domain